MPFQEWYEFLSGLTSVFVAIFYSVFLTFLHRKGYFLGILFVKKSGFANFAKIELKKTEWLKAQNV